MLELFLLQHEDGSDDNITWKGVKKLHMQNMVLWKLFDSDLIKLGSGICNKRKGDNNGDLKKR